MIKKNKGFTLAELLIVVAIIAVLVAIAIPVFTSQLEKSREATDLANVRAAYAEVMSAAMSSDHSATSVNYDSASDTYSKSVSPLKQTVAGWSLDEDKLSIGGIEHSKGEPHWIGDPTDGGGSCKVYYSEANGVVIEWSGEYKNTTTSHSSVINIYHSYGSSMNKAMTSISTSSYCVNSTCSNHSKIKEIAASIQKNDETFLDKVVTWAVVRDTNKAAGNATNSYLMSTFDISGLSAGTEVPAIQQLSNGQYKVGYATVSAAQDYKKSNGNTPYNIITTDVNGNYAYNYDTNGNGSKNTAYQYENLLQNATQYSSEEEALAAYSSLVSSYLNENPNMHEG